MGKTSVLRVLEALESEGGDGIRGVLAYETSVLQTSEALQPENRDGRAQLAGG